MKKLKTRKVISKRIHRTKNGKKGGKILIRTAGQDHFNGREGGKITRNKRRDKTTTKKNVKNIKRSV